MPKNFKRKPPLTPPKEGNRKNFFPQIIKESNLSLFQAPALSHAVAGCRFHVSG
jgi:hypothetical protein